MYSKKIKTMIYFGSVIALKDDFIAKKILFMIFL